MVGSSIFQFRRFAVLIGVLFLCFVFSSELSYLEAQQGRGTISGTVTDPSGAAVPGASITITSVGTNAVFTTQSNEEGFFTAPGLAVGEYVVSAERQGFKTAVRKGITLQVDQKAQVNVRWTSERSPKASRWWRNLPGGRRQRHARDGD